MTHSTLSEPVPGWEVGTQASSSGASLGSRHTCIRVHCLYIHSCNKNTHTALHTVPSQYSKTNRGVTFQLCTYETQAGLYSLSGCIREGRVYRSIKLLQMFKNSCCWFYDRFIYQKKNLEKNLWESKSNKFLTI